MRVPGKVFADAELVEAIAADGSLEQLRNVATLPGVVDGALAMPDVHQGYGSPVGGVAATKPRGVSFRRPGDVLIHARSRGLGHQVCTDYVKRFDATMGRHGIRLPDRQLVHAPIGWEERRAYLAAMAAAANFTWANRQLLGHRVRGAIAKVLGEQAAAGTRQVYDVAHNVAKIEHHGGR